MMLLEDLIAVLPQPLTSYSYFGLAPNEGWWEIYAEAKAGFNHPPINRHVVYCTPRSTGREYSVPPYGMSLMLDMLNGHLDDVKKVIG